MTETRTRYKSLLDVLQDAGDLGERPESERRHDAGMWLRRLYQRTHRDLPIDQDRAQAELRDELAEDNTLYRRTMLAMGPEFGVLRTVCCADRPARLSLLLRALDKLADWRGA